MNVRKTIALCAWSGALLLCIGTYMHPMQADPNQAVAAFTEYAASRHWVGSHLAQLFGVILITAALLLLARLLSGGRAAAWASVGGAAAVSSLALAAALQAVDGIALKAMVDGWVAAPAAEQAAAFHAAFAVRQIEIGLAAVSSMVSGLGFLLFGLALAVDGRLAKWLCLLAIGGGTGMAAAGIAISHTGFSELSMQLNMPASLLLVVWLIGLGAACWRGSLAADLA